MKRTATVCSALVFFTACCTPTVSDGRHAQEVAAAISDLNDGKSEPCLHIMGRAPLTSGDVVGPASVLCGRTGRFKDVADISQRNEGIRSFVTIRFKQGADIELLFERGILVLANSKLDFPHPPAIP